MTKQCSRPDCGRFAEAGSDICFTHRVKSVGFSLRAPAVDGDFHRTASDWRREHFGTDDEKELGRRGIERV